MILPVSLGNDEWVGKHLCLICANLRRSVHQPSDPIIRKDQLRSQRCMKLSMSVYQSVTLDKAVQAVIQGVKKCFSYDLAPKALP